MIRFRRAAAVALLRAASWNLRALAAAIRWATGREHIQPADPLHLPVETLTQQLRTIDVLMQQIRRP